MFPATTASASEYLHLSELFCQFIWTSKPRHLKFLPAHGPSAWSMLMPPQMKHDDVPVLTILKAAVFPTLRGILIHGIRGGGLFTLYGGSQRLHCGLGVCAEVKGGEKHCSRLHRHPAGDDAKSENLPSRCELVRRKGKVHRCAHNLNSPVGAVGGVTRVTLVEW